MHYYVSSVEYIVRLQQFIPHAGIQLNAEIF